MLIRQIKINIVLCKMMNKCDVNKNVYAKSLWNVACRRRYNAITAQLLSYQVADLHSDKFCNIRLLLMMALLLTYCSASKFPKFHWIRRAVLIVVMWTLWIPSRSFCTHSDPPHSFGHRFQERFFPITLLPLTELCEWCDFIRCPTVNHLNTIQLIFFDAYLVHIQELQLG